MSLSVCDPSSSSSCSVSSSSYPLGMGSMPNLSVGLSSVPIMPSVSILTPIPVNPASMLSVQPLVPTPVTLPLVGGLGNSGLPNGNMNLLSPPLLSSNAGWSCSGSSRPGLNQPSEAKKQQQKLLCCSCFGSQ